MTRKTNAVYSKNRRAKILKEAKGFFGNKSKLFTYAKDAVFRAKKYQYFDRKKKKSILRNG
jgi:large subunit ribosomal protein L20